LVTGTIVSRQRPEVIGTLKLLGNRRTAPYGEVQKREALSFGLFDLFDIRQIERVYYSN
jgi:hypothetical protein